MADIPLATWAEATLYVYNSQGVPVTPDALPQYRVLEENNDTPVVAYTDMVQRAGTVGLYVARFQVAAASGFEVAKTYHVDAKATVNSVTPSLVIDSFRCVSADALRASLSDVAAAVLTEDVATHKGTVGSLAWFVNLIARLSGWGLRVFHKTAKTMTTYDGDAPTDPVLVVETGVEDANEITWTPTP